MPGRRVAAVGVVLVLVSGMAAGGAAAQTTPGEPPGKPLQLLQVVSHPTKTKVRRHVRLAAHGKHAIRIHRKRPRPATQSAAAPPTGDVRPTATAAAPAAVTANEAAPQPTAAPADPVPSERVVTSETIRVAPPDATAPADPAADGQQAQTASAAPSATTADVQPVAAAAAVSEPEPQASALTATPARPVAGAVGSASWIAKVLAAFGGAVAAGSLAWFLIGPAPQRTWVNGSSDRGRAPADG